MDFGVNCSALTQGRDKIDPSRVNGTELAPIRNGDVRQAFILFKRSDFGIDFYFETQGMNKLLVRYLNTFALDTLSCFDY